MLPGNKTKIQNLGTGSLDASINVEGNIVDGVTDFTWALSLVNNRLRKNIANQTMHLIGLVASALSNFSRIWC